MAEQPTTQRIIPGAPPPSALSKSQLKKKRKTKAKADDSEAPVSIPDTTSAALVEKAPEPEEVKKGAVAPELVAQPEPPVRKEAKSSPIVELVNKRIKATNKKLMRITGYATADPATLNEDQKRTLATVPALEAVTKELVEVKGAVEAHESELAHELAVKEREAASAQEKRIAEAVSAAARDYTSTICELLSFLRLRSIIASGEADPSSFGINQNEVEAVFSITDILAGTDDENKENLVNGFLSGEGVYESVPYSRLVEIIHNISTPVAPEAPPAMEPEVREQSQEEPPAQVVQSEVVIGTVPMSSSGGSFHFMQASELESPNFDHAEWVDSSEVAVVPVDQVPPVNGHVDPISVPESAAAEVAPIDWAAEGEDELPSIDGLHATFGKSGSVTPVVPNDVAQVPHVNGDVAAADNTTISAADDDGFTQARGGRGRGRGSRGGERGFRGSGFRGGERGRGRGGDRSHGHRGRGDWRGGDGEHRGRGGRRGGRGGADRNGPSANHHEHTH
ncbi:hypothetical protein D9758_006791 [Tetrapyrgos nigripes]|uniref:Uncharacterized protein n=1 Tax=Tetrapyrgos nigripes TaxID=182062 RepID=A0A8H5CW92_9AGAR|nr:hypothetical protein D9758_006791 [Tetrapyrgos nigripes]